MKHVKFMIFAVLLSLALLLGVSMQATATPSWTPVTGTCGLLPEPPSPDVMTWYTGQNEVHVRNEFQAVACDMSDDRLDGVYLEEVNWDGKMYTDPFWYFIGHDYGPMSLTTAGGDLLWQGEHNFFFTKPWIIEDGQIILHGQGPFKGLKATLSVDVNFGTDGVIYMNGTLFEQ